VILAHLRDDTFSIRCGKHASLHMTTQAPSEYLLLRQSTGPDAMKLMHRLPQSTWPRNSEPEDDLRLLVDVTIDEIGDNSLKGRGETH
jgi:hypothetical protein